MENKKTKKFLNLIILLILFLTLIIRVWGNKNENIKMNNNIKNILLNEIKNETILNKIENSTEEIVNKTILNEIENLTEDKNDETTNITENQEDIENSNLSIAEDNISLKIISANIDRSCYQQTSGKLASDNLCLWNGKSVVGDGKASYYMAHDYTYYGKIIKNLLIGDLISIDGVNYKIATIEIVPKYEASDEISNAYWDCESDFSEDKAYLQTCMDDNLMCLKTAYPVK